MKSSRLLLKVGACAALLGTSAAAHATCSAEPILGSICIVAFNFCPQGYASAEGQLLPINQNTALFSLLGTYYGGNGTTNFALPDLRGRVPVGQGQGPGLSPIDQGQVGGNETIQLTAAQMPAHTHSAQLMASSANGSTDNPSGATMARLPRSNIYSGSGPDTNMSASAVSIGTSGSSQPIPIRDPMLGLRYCIAMQGIFPARP
ncbi:MAG TPA: tail fiber protein [Burkholderiaceae bacterium]|jgi:microcystin-dependent protein